MGEARGSRRCHLVPRLGRSARRDGRSPAGVGTRLNGAGATAKPQYIRLSTRRRTPHLPERPRPFRKTMRRHAYQLPVVLGQAMNHRRQFDDRRTAVAATVGDDLIGDFLHLGDEQRLTRDGSRRVRRIGHGENRFG
jgi:hypothetical protein